MLLAWGVLFVGGVGGCQKINASLNPFFFFFRFPFFVADGSAEKKQVINS